MHCSSCTQDANNTYELCERCHKDNHWPSTHGVNHVVTRCSDVGVDTTFVEILQNHIHIPSVSCAGCSQANLDDYYRCSECDTEVCYHCFYHGKNVWSHSHSHKMSPYQKSGRGALAQYFNCDGCSQKIWQGSSFVPSYSLCT